ncbi:bifunctional D-glycero-beta-D-manno-heptose-7-phosphate kinase/D-glycero-beta-D-manno-heptose 1-phosphate adenylyltransferase HldE [Methylococcus sp. EFPC2]|uniref:bifunctional D-glycero-beta-D-manno-heptose-7-phosphate kinase/D-glycero-beta-D-manno-heptose 1-phosphate adenylyltransferase HldE n=1 Tax=Methylococcus sp. EFPC2 TaxID=2812648 RepID=UPI001967AE63|nr:bifunctional D-glycero-beta-D-manno-heptose-7-phosphate kinase/D-glycero-beta-D-manno-heptose 1-phosphate adenylyltransferase HldE [Methylococcus sp. EFPC2]QSA97999.1 bifunctional D-glycero-beta-D-manno-heptose-7-phosphate kinase/D-glycero-beta-D-manno-heptose 1-phosphate adenylyltransferase HldE [Methylococcus sp. EFPC2]
MQLPDFKSAKVLVAGDLMLDRYWRGGTARVSPEAPVPVVHVQGNEERAGGAGNVALNLAVLGVDVRLLGYVGRDETGDALLALLDRAGIKLDIQRPTTLPTITKLRVISRHQQLLRLDFEESFQSVDPQPLLNSYESDLDRADLVVLSDYGKGSLSAVPAMIRLARAAGKPILVDPKGSNFAKYAGADLLTPNLAEFEAVVGRCRDEREIEEKGGGLLAELDLGALLITRGEQGMSLLRPHHAPLHLPTRAREVYDVTGAGDTVISVLAGCLAAGSPLDEATALANLAAGLVVSKLGTASVTQKELNEALHGPRAHARGVIGMDELLKTLAAARREGEKIVLTNGCFDILHLGHVRYLQEARALGDRLIVLVNSDESVARLKGPGRPVNPLADRMAMLAALECVDWVLPFDEYTPREAICRILPDVLVKGGDYSRIEDIAGHDCVLAHGGEVRLLSFVDGYSTTRIIESLRHA